MKQSDVGAFVSKLRDTFMQLEVCPIPTICAIDGGICGVGGLKLKVTSSSGQGLHWVAAWRLPFRATLELPGRRPRLDERFLLFSFN